MYRLLIVDDLPIIVDGLLELFDETDHLQLEVMKAYSGEEALEVLSHHRIDIVISDIKMPGLEGIELLREIKSQWPACKVIFLTGYNDFHYAKSAITYGGFDYILKVESDEKIIQSVERAIEKIEEENNQEQMIARAQSKMRLALPSLQKEYVWELFQGKHVSDSQLKQAFKEIDIRLDATLPVYLLIGRVDAWKEMFTTPDKALLTYAVQNICDEYLSMQVRCYSVVFELSKIVWMIKKIAENELAGPDALSIGVDQATQLFQNNKAAMLALGQWYLRDHLSKMKDDKDLDAFTMPWRETTSERLQAITMPDQYMAINKNSNNTEEVKAFLEWVFSRDVYQVYINYSQNSSTVINIESFLPFFNNVKENHPFEPFMYLGIDEKFEKVKNAIQFDEKKAAQEIFSGADVSDIQEKLNDDWERAVQALK